MLIQWCLIFKLIFHRNVEWLWMCTKSGCVKRHNSWKHDLWVPWTRAGSVLALLPTSCVSWGKLPELAELTWSCWASPFSFALGHNEWVDTLGCLCKIHSLPASLLTHGLIHSGLGHPCMQSNLDLFAVSEGKYCLG